MLKHQVGNCGGIRKSLKTRSFVLIINPNVPKYSDVCDWFEIMYDGQFTRGNRDQVMKGMNKALNETEWTLHVYEGTLDSYTYIGEYVRVGTYNTVYDVGGRRVFSFPIRRKFQFESFEY